MDHSEIEGETQIGTFGEVDPLKTTPGKVVEKKAKPAKAGPRSYKPLVIAVGVLGILFLGGLKFFELQQQIDGIQQIADGLRLETIAKGGTIANLAKELKSREEALQQSRAEAAQLKGQVETVRLALMEKDGQIARLQQTAQFSAKLPKKTRDLQAQLVQKQIENASLQNALMNQSGWVRLLSSPNVHLVRMIGSKEAGTAGGLLLFDPKNQAGAFYGFDLPKLPAGKVYQLWTIGETKVSAGLFQPSGDRTAVMKIPKMNGEIMKEFTVTMEPVGGKPQPSGPIYLKGAIAGIPSL